MSVKQLAELQLALLLQHPNEEVRKLAAELLAKLVVLELEENKVDPYKLRII